MTHYHFVGIKGSGMSSLAQIMHDLGHEVQGSDIENTYLPKLLYVTKASKFYLLMLKILKKAWLSFRVMHFQTIMKK